MYLGQLELVVADLLQPGSFDRAFDGCSYVFHTASPFFIDATDPQAELIEPAVQVCTKGLPTFFHFVEVDGRSSAKQQ
jgi:hypothetical protein